MRSKKSSAFHAVLDKTKKIQTGYKMKKNMSLKESLQRDVYRKTYEKKLGTRERFGERTLNREQY